MPSTDLGGAKGGGGVSAGISRRASGRHDVIQEVFADSRDYHPVPLTQGKKVKKG